MQVVHQRIQNFQKLKFLISNEEIKDIIKIDKSLEESGLLIKGISKTITNEAEEQKERFLGMWLGALAASMLGSALTGKGVLKASEWIIRAGEHF